ncbi:MAG: desulfoferrodoxin family protein [Methylococcales bacterium]
MKRRDFIRLTAASAGASLIVPTISWAEEAKPVSPSQDIYYTKEASGRWAGKAATHVPVIDVTKAEGSATVKITTPHEMKGYEHYIVKHVLLDKNYKFLDEHLFDPTKETLAVSSYTLKDYSGTVYALSTCNKHDLWLSSAEV